MSLQDSAALRLAGVVLLAVVAAAAVVVAALSRRGARRALQANRLLQAETQERERIEASAFQSDKMESIRRITGGVAHDFNNLLMVASSGLDLIDRTQDEVRRKALKDGIRQALDRGAGLSRQLLAFSRRTPLKSEVVDLGSQIGALRGQLEQSLREDIKIEVVAAADLWPVRIDAAQFDQALLNIAANARDAMPAGGTMTIAADNVAGLADSVLHGDFVRLTITDQGQGMAREILGKVFEPFFTTREVGKGTGLGLSQVYGFAQSSSGDVRLYSTPGEGTAVILYLPRSLEGLEQARPATVFKPSRSIGQGGQLLVVEDDDAVAGMVTQMLEELGYRPVRAPTASAALAALERVRDFEMVFSDMVMPGGMSGIQLAREIALLRPDLPVLLTTGFSDAADAARSDGLRLLPKPYDIKALGEAVQDTLAARRR